MNMGSATEKKIKFELYLTGEGVVSNTPKCNQSVKIFLIAVGLIWITAVKAADTRDSLAAADSAAHRVLILKGNSYLENAVTKIISDSLHHHGFNLSTDDWKKAGHYPPSKYRAILIFSSIKANQTLDPQIEGYLDSKGVADAQNILVFSVHGRLWPDSTRTIYSVDAITAATRTLDPIKISNQIVQQFYRTTGIKKE
jgi:hypothetical protein